MHTFFINTSGNEIENYSEILQIQHETRKLVSLDCSLSQWSHPQEGYKGCVDKMGELIDSYKDINNSFNLILYVDLTSFADYANIPMSNHRERYACLNVMYSMIRKYMCSTIVAELENYGRSPQEILIIFEENSKPEDGEVRTEDGKALIRSYVGKLLGFSDVAKLQEIVAAVPECEEITESMKSVIHDMCATFIPDLSTVYDSLIDLFLREIKESGQLELPLGKLLTRIYDEGNACVSRLQSVSFVTNRHIGGANKQEYTRCDLRLIFYIFDCVEQQSIFETGYLEKGEDASLCVKQFPEINWDIVTEEILKKGREFKNQYQSILNLSGSFTDVELAPVLYSFDHKKFSLDQYGKRDISIDVVDDETSEKSQEGESETLGLAKKKSLVVSAKYSESLFPAGAYKPFDYEGEEEGASIPGAKAEAKDYISAACRLREHHIKYFKRLKLDITDKLSNYAGHSLENVSALLKKRRVSLNEELCSTSDSRRNYTDETESAESKKIDTVKEISKTAYESVVLSYLEFCAGRSVSLTDIEKLCDSFITYVCQVEESLKKIKKIFLGISIMLLMAYIPFVLVQWNSISKNLASGLYALVSVVAPAVLMYLAFGFSLYLQKKKFAVAYDEFRKKSNGVLEQNALVAKKYDQLLSVFIPTLRWVYEYKIDVDFYVECCRLAKAKINHHIQMLQERITIVKNIIDDLEITEDAVEDFNQKVKESKAFGEIDYNVSYCSSKKNQKFYSLIDKDFLDKIKA